MQQQVREQVDRELSSLRARIRFGDGDGPSIRNELRSVWEVDFAPTSEAFDATTSPRLEWSGIDANLEDAVEPIVVKTINGTAQDALEYFEHRAAGLNVIAIGGDKLSRGLTLEGLTVSYYLRASRAYDTLLQMGRWFGYRDGYEDLCRLWTTPALWQAYRGIRLLAGSAAALLIGAELFVEHAAAAGRRLGVTGLAVELLLAGAEPEELITAVTAVARDRPGIAVGDAIGANITMLTLALGLAALVAPLPGP